MLRVKRPLPGCDHIISHRIERVRVNEVGEGVPYRLSLRPWIAASVMVMALVSYVITKF